MITLFRFGIMKASPFLDLPVYSGAVRRKHMHAIETHVALMVDRVVCENERERNKSSTVLRPGFQNGKGFEVGFFHHLLRRGAPATLRAHGRHAPEHSAGSP